MARLGGRLRGVWVGALALGLLACSGAEPEALGTTDEAVPASPEEWVAQQQSELTWASKPGPEAKAVKPIPVAKRVSVEIVSGTYQGKRGEAVVVYDRAKAQGVGRETLDNASMWFWFLGRFVQGKAQVVLQDGAFQDVLWVASTKNPRGESFNFGFNAGFGRWQFGRPSEQFIPDGKSYFAYLFPNTYVDGAGVLRYSDLCLSSKVKKFASVDVVSGSHRGEKGRATFVYDAKQVKGRGAETLDGVPVAFEFMGQVVKGQAQVLFVDGKFQDVAWVSSVKNREGESFNFGFNAGFDRNQFGRRSERFIPEGKSYFGYLFPDTYVDGAGTVTYADGGCGDDFVPTPR